MTHIHPIVWTLGNLVKIRLFSLLNRFQLISLKYIFYSNPLKVRGPIIFIIAIIYFVPRWLERIVIGALCLNPSYMTGAKEHKSIYIKKPA